MAEARETCSVPGPVHDTQVRTYRIVDVASGVRTQVTICTLHGNRASFNAVKGHGRSLPAVAPSAGRRPGRHNWGQYVRWGPGSGAGDSADRTEGE